MRIASPFCRKGHKMAGANLLWHTRYGEDGKKFMVRECRTCANERYRSRRSAKRRNRELAEEAMAASITQGMEPEIKAPPTERPEALFL